MHAYADALWVRVQVNNSMHPLAQWGNKQLFNTQGNRKDLSLSIPAGPLIGIKGRNVCLIEEKNNVPWQRLFVCQYNWHSVHFINDLS